MNSDARKRLAEHVCDSGNFDRSICPEPCGSMHSYCDTCGRLQDRCAHDDRPTPTVPDETEAVEAQIALLAPWRCCVHCTDDELHTSDLTNNHEIPCDTCLLDRMAYERGARSVAERVEPVLPELRGVIETLTAGSGGPSDPFHVGADAAHDLRLVLDRLSDDPYPDADKDPVVPGLLAEARRSTDQSVEVWGGHDLSWRTTNGGDWLCSECQCARPSRWEFTKFNCQAPHGEIVTRDMDGYTLYVCADCGQNINNPKCRARSTQPDPPTFTSLLSDPTQQLDPEGLILASIAVSSDETGTVEVWGKFCGQKQPHNPHTWSTQHGLGLYTQCAGYADDRDTIAAARAEGAREVVERVEAVLDTLIQNWRQASEVETHWGPDGARAYDVCAADLDDLRVVLTPSDEVRPGCTVVRGVIGCADLDHDHTPANEEWF